MLITINSPAGLRTLHSSDFCVTVQGFDVFVKFASSDQVTYQDVGEAIVTVGGLRLVLTNCYITSYSFETSINGELHVQ